MKVIDVIFIGMLFMMTIAILSHGQKFLERDLQELKSVCRRTK